MTTPAEDGGGAIRAMIMELEDGNVPLDEVDYINTHGTSTPYNDRLETLAIKNVFKDKAYNLCVSSTKSMTRHCSEVYKLNIEFNGKYRNFGLK